MKFKEITIENFKGTPDRTYKLEEMNILIGENGAGKTSFMNAVRFLLNGKLPPDPIRHGKEYLHVSAILDDGQDTKIERFVYCPDTYRVNGETVTSRQFTGKVAESRTAARPDEGLVILQHTNSFFRGQNSDTLWGFLETGKAENARIQGIKELEVLTPDGTEFYIRRSKPSKVAVNGKKVTVAALDKLVADRIGGVSKSLDIVTSSEVMTGLGMDELAEYLISVVPVSIDFNKLSELAGLSDTERSVLQPLFPEPPAAITLADVASVYKMLFASRTEISRQADEWKKRSMFDGPLPVMDREQTQKQLEEFSAQIGESRQIAKMHEIYRKRQEERAKCQENYRQCAQKYNSLQASPIPQGCMEQLRREEEQLRQQNRTDEDIIARVQQANAPLMKMINNLDSQVCPLCDRLACTTDKTACKADIYESIRLNNGMADESRKRLNERRVQLMENRRKQDEITVKIQDYEKKVLLYKQLCQIKETIPQLPEEPPKMPDMEKLGKECEQYKRYLEQATLYASCVEAEKKYREMDAQYRLYTGLVKKAEPKKGLLINTILGFILAPFREHCNQFLKNIYEDMDVLFKMDEKGFQVYCRPHGRTSYMPLKALSTGERMLFTFALMDMISTMSNTRMLFFDGMEALDEETFKMLVLTLARPEIRSRYDHVILACVEHTGIAALLNEADGCVIRI